MANTRVVSDGLAVTAWFGLPNFAANPAKPTPTEVNATTNITASIAWDGFGFGAQASTQNSDPSWIDVGNLQTRGFAQFGGAISFFYPGSYAVDATNANYVTFAALKNPRTLGYLIIRVDGKKTTTTTAALANDFVNVYAVQTDGYDDAVEGSDSFKYSISFVGQSNIYTNATVATTVTVVTPIAVGTANYSVAANGKTPLSSYITGRQMYSNTGVFSGTPSRFIWTSSAPSIASVDRNGVVRALAVGSASITATDGNSGVASTPLAVTIVA